MLNVTTNYEWDGSAEDLWFNAKIQEYANGTSLFPDQDLAMRFSYESLPKQAQGLDWVSTCTLSYWRTVRRLTLYLGLSRRTRRTESTSGLGGRCASWAGGNG